MAASLSAGSRPMVAPAVMAAVSERDGAVSTSVRGTAALGLLVAVPAFLAYAATLSPSITWAHGATDSAELATAAYTFGVPHPTGYPLWLLLAAPLARLPIGSDVAWRLGLLSALCAALAAGAAAMITERLVRRLGSNDGDATLAGAVAGIALATSSGVWNVAVVTETYGLHLLLLVLLLGLSLLAAPALLLALLGGLALANHVTSLPAVATALVTARGTGPRRLLAAIGLLPGLLLYLVLLWRARQHPAANWGDPASLGALWQHVNGSTYHYLLVVPSPAAAALRFLAAVQSLVTQFPLWLWPLAILGLPVLAGTWRGKVWLSIAALYLLLPVFYRAAGVEHYLLPDVAVLAVAAGLGTTRVLPALARRHRSARRWVWPVTGLVALLGGVVTGAQASLRQDTTARDWAVTTLTAAAPSSTITTTLDQQTFPLWYGQRVLHLRPDVRVIDERLLSQPWYQRQVEQGR